MERISLTRPVDQSFPVNILWHSADQFGIDFMALVYLSRAHGHARTLSSLAYFAKMAATFREGQIFKVLISGT